MQCTFCASKNVCIINSRPKGDYYRVRRYRCTECNKTFGTIELLQTEYKELRDATSNRAGQVSQST